MTALQTRIKKDSVFSLNIEPFLFSFCILSNRLLFNNPFWFLIYRIIYIPLSQIQETALYEKTKSLASSMRLPSLLLHKKMQTLSLVSFYSIYHIHFLFMLMQFFLSLFCIIQHFCNVFFCYSVFFSCCKFI